MTSDSNGNAAVEVLDSDQNAVDVVADFTNEGILRDISVNFAVVGSSGGTPPPPASSSTPGTITTVPAATSTSDSGTTAPTTAILRAVGMSGSSAGKSHKVKEQITLLRLVSPVHGKHYVLIKVKSSASSAKVQLRLISAAGHATTAGHHSKTTSSSKTVKVQTNRQVKVTVSSTVRKIKAAKLLT